MKVRFYKTFSKRKNSTKKITSETYTELDLTLKEPTDIEHPTFILSGDQFNYVYAYVADWNRYYFVNKVISVNNALTEISFVEDYLASWKSEVGNTAAHIEYSSTGYNVNYIDPRISVKSSKLKYASSPEELGFDSTGAYIIGIINDQSFGKVGAVSYYLITETSLQKLIAHLTDPSIVSDITQIFTGDWLQLIPTCIWIPVAELTVETTFGAGIGPGHSLTIGSSALASLTFSDVTVHDITKPSAQLGGTVSVDIPFKWLDFRDCQPYTSASIYLPGLGMVDININDFYESSSVNIITRMDCTTGDITYMIFDDNMVLLKTIMFNGGVQVALAHIVSNAGGTLAGVGGTVGGLVGIGVSAATGNIPGVIAAGVGVVAGASNTLLAANQRSASIKGANTGRSAFAITYAQVILVCMETEDPDDANYIAKWGRPVCLTQAILNHSGYVKCNDASINIPGLDSEREMLNSYLNGGFYYE